MFTNVDANAEGRYTVAVTNNLGTVVSQEAEVILLGSPSITQQPANATVFENAAATFSIGASGSGLRYQWLRNGAAIPGANQASCTTPLLTLANSGAVYSVIVFNGAGVELSAGAVLTVQAFVPPFNLTATTLASLSSTGTTANSWSYSPSLSADGRLLAFISDGTNLVPGVTNPPANGGNAYVRNLVTGAITLVNQTPGGSPSMYGVIGLKLAAGGRYAVFTSLADDLVADDNNGSQDVFLRDLQTGVTKRLNLLPNGSQITGAGNGNNGDMQIDISADGRFVSFVYAHDLVGNGPPVTPVLYLRDTQTDQTRLVGSNPVVWHLVFGARERRRNSGVRQRLIPVDGDCPSRHQCEHHRYALHVQHGQRYGLPRGRTQHLRQWPIRSVHRAFPRIAEWFDRCSGGGDRSRFPSSIIIASTGANGSGDGASSYPKLSDDGHVLFATYAANLTGNVNPSRQMLVVRDLQSSAISVASRTPAGAAVWTASGVIQQPRVVGGWHGARAGCR